MATAGQFNNYEFPPKFDNIEPTDSSKSREVSFSSAGSRPLKPKKSILRPSPQSSPPVSPGLIPDEGSPFKTRDKVRRTFAGTAFKALVEGDTTLQRQIFKPDPLDYFIEEKTPKKPNNQVFSINDSQPKINSYLFENQVFIAPTPSNFDNNLFKTKEVEIESTTDIQELIKPTSLSNKESSHQSQKPSACNSDFSDDVSVVVLQRGKSLKSKKLQIEAKAQSKASFIHKSKESNSYIPSSLNPQNNKTNIVAPEPPVTSEPQKYFIKKRVTPTSSSHHNSPSEVSEILEMHSKKDNYFNNPSYPQKAYQPSLPGSGTYNFSSLSSYSNYEKDALIRAHHSNHTNSGSDPFSIRTKPEPTTQEQPNGCACLIL